MATGTQVPWTTPGGTPCCCGGGVDCQTAFDDDLWSGQPINRGGVSQEILATMLFLSSEQAANIYAGGTWTLGNYSAGFSLSGTNGSNAVFSCTGNVGGSYTTPSSNTSSCVRELSFAFLGGSATGTVEAVPRPNGTDSTSCSSSVGMFYQIVESNTNVFRIYIGISAGISTGFFRMPQSAPFQEFSCTASARASSGLTNGSIVSTTISFLDTTISVNGSSGFIDGNYDVDTVSSYSGTISGVLTFTPSAP